MSRCRTSDIFAVRSRPGCPWLRSIPTAERLERAYDREARIVALDVPDREAILRVLEECPEGLLELRATLLPERVWLRREGLA